jgi:CheY-like chemotaxis protein
LLVVDDDYDIASLIKIGLEKIGLSVSSFTDPLLAIEEFRKKPSDYELVISDVRMPSMNGYEFVKQVKKIDPHASIFMSIVVLFQVLEVLSL